VRKPWEGLSQRIGKDQARGQVQPERLRRRGWRGRRSQERQEDNCWLAL
jgi:hypothetical protein